MPVTILPMGGIKTPDTARRITYVPSQATASPAIIAAASHQSAI